MVKEIDPILMHKIAVFYALKTSKAEPFKSLRRRAEYQFITRAEEIDLAKFKDEDIKIAWETKGAITYVAQILDVARGTLYAKLKEYPLPPKRRYAVYEDFWDIPEVQTFYQALKKNEKKKMTYIQKMWLETGRKHPKDWTRDDLVQILKLFPDPQNIIPNTMRFDVLVFLRKFLKAVNRQLFDASEDLLSTKGHKRRKGAKRLWYLTPSEVRAILNTCSEENDLEMYFYIMLHWKTGARFSGLKNTKWSDVVLDKNMIFMFEVKTRKQWIKFIDDELKATIKQYILTFNPQPTDPLLRHSYDYYNTMLKYYATKVNISKYRIVRDGRRMRAIYESGKPISTHLLRHSFAYLCSINGLSLELTAELGGWDDVTTLKDFYYPILSEQLQKAYFSLKWDKGLEQTEKAKLIAEKFETPPEKEEIEELEKEAD